MKCENRENVLIRWPVYKLAEQFPKKYCKNDRKEREKGNQEEMPLQVVQRSEYNKDILESVGTLRRIKYSLLPQVDHF